jgi:hypothetical protein
MPAHIFWGNYLPAKSRLAGLAATVGLFLVIGISGLKEHDESFSHDAARQQYYCRLAKKLVHQAQLSQYKSCSLLRSEDTLIPPHFVLAIIAVENYGRPPFRRWLQEILARACLAVCGKVPDFSLGIGQVKLSTARMVLQLQAPGSAEADAKLLDLLLNPWENLRIVQGYLELLMEQNGFHNFNKPAAIVILKQYNGQVSSGQCNQIYQEVVWEAFRYLALNEAIYDKESHLQSLPNPLAQH